MKIGFDGRSINWYNGTGIGTYSNNLLINLLNIDKTNDFNIFWNGNNYNKYKTVNSNYILTSRRQHSYYEDCLIPSFIKKNNMDIYHIPQNGIGYSDTLTCKTIVTIHDLIPYIMPQTVGSGYLKKFLTQIPRILDKCNGIITVSEYSKQDIIRFFPDTKDKVYVTPLAADSIYKPLDKEICKHSLNEKYNMDKPFILYVGGFSERKNVESIIQSFHNIYKKLNKEYNLIILGSIRDKLSTLKSLVEKLDMNENIKFLGFIENNMLPVFYSAADVFIYPSFYEGFGLPPLEAMSCGCPVISSNTTSIPEVIKDAGILIDPYNIKSIENALESVLNNNTLRENLSLKGLSRSSLFSWDNTAKLTLDAYNEVYKK
ncbi:MAG: glycosyltransferase family 4 protein [Clostridiaceae bacterium]